MQTKTQGGGRLKKKSFRFAADDLERLERLSEVTELNHTEVLRRLLRTARVEMRPAPVAGDLTAERQP